MTSRREGKTQQSNNNNRQLAIVRSLTLWPGTMPNGISSKYWSNQLLKVSVYRVFSELDLKEAPLVLRPAETHKDGSTPVTQTARQRCARLITDRGEHPSTTMAMTMTILCAQEKNSNLSSASRRADRLVRFFSERIT